MAPADSPNPYEAPRTTGRASPCGNAVWIGPLLSLSVVSGTLALLAGVVDVVPDHRWKWDLSAAILGVVGTLCLCISFGLHRRMRRSGHTAN